MSPTEEERAAIWADFLGQEGRGWTTDLSREDRHRFEKWMMTIGVSGAKLRLVLERREANEKRRR